MANELTVREELEQLHPQFKQALVGTGISPDKFILVITTALRLNPDLRNCDRRSLLNAAMRAAADGLVPDGRDGALVPFQGKVSWMPMVGGIRKKVRRTGEVTNWDVTAVHAKDRFDFELGDSPWIKHKPWMPPPLPRNESESDADYNARLREHLRPGPLTFVYSVATLKGGDKSRDVMSRAEVEYIRDTYARKDKKGEFSPAWRKGVDEMAKKTIARRHAKQLPMSSDVVALLHRDDELYDVERERAKRIQAPSDLDNRLEMLAAGVDPETGEFVDSPAGASTPLAQESAASQDPSEVLGDDGGEGAAQSSGTEALARSGERGGGSAPHAEAATEPEPEPSPAAGSQAPPGAPQTPASAPGGSPQKPQSTLQQGHKIALKGRQELEHWVNNLPPDEMAKVSLAQLKTWRTVADKVGP